MINSRANSDYIDTNSVDVLNCRRLPARLTIHQVAVLLNFQPYELLLLMRLGLLKCLNSPIAGVNCRKFFSTVYIQTIVSNQAWLNQATKAVARAIREKNGGQSDAKRSELQHSLYLKAQNIVSLTATATPANDFLKRLHGRQRADSIHHRGCDCAHWKRKQDHRPCLQ